MTGKSGLVTGTRGLVGYPLGASYCGYLLSRRNQQALLRWYRLSTERAQRPRGSPLTDWYLSRIEGLTAPITLKLKPKIWRYFGVKLKGRGRDIQVF